MVNATSYPYDLTNISNVNSTVDFIGQVDQMTGGIFLPGFLFVIMVVCFFALQRFGNTEALMISLFITTISSGIFMVLGWIDIIYVMLIASAFALTVVFYK